MDANHRDKRESQLSATEDKLWLPPLSLKDQKRLKRLQKKSLAERMGFSGKTPWDLIQLLLIPLVLAGVGFWFSAQQNQTSLQVSERQHQADLQIAATRYANDQQLAADQQRETTLKTYLDDMSNLLLNNKLLESKPGDAVRQVARERTLTTLRRLEANRNRIVLQFLQDAKLISGKNAVIDLNTADLSGDDLSFVNLSNTELTDANLSRAKLTNADLRGADLSEAYLGDADLSGAQLNNADLRGAFLNSTDLSYADLSDANLSRGNVERELLICPIKGCTSLTNDPRETNLVDANLTGANLTGADLTGANLSGANLSGANLTGTKVTQAQLDEAKSLQGATMPNGSTHP